MNEHACTTLTADEARFLDVVQRLWPGADVRTDACGRETPASRAGSRQESTHLLVPGRGRPRMLLPDSRLLAADAVRGTGCPPDTGARLRNRMVVALLAHGRGRLRGRRLTISAPRGASSIESHLADVLGARVRVALRLGPPRANSKPVLQVMNARGRTVAFAKVGHNRLTRELVGAEARALRRLGSAGLRVVQTPTALHEGSWEGLHLLVQSALRSDSRDRPGAHLVTQAMQEVALSGEVRVEALAESAYARRLQDRLARLPHDDSSAILHRAMGALLAVNAPARWWFGSWHGDWTKWNTRAHADRLQVWDWERCEAPVPVGFDAVHLHLQGLLAHPSQRSGSAARVLDDAVHVLSRWSMPADQRRAVATAYLVDIGTRYLTDDQTAAGNHAGRLEAWLLPALAHEASRLANSTRSDERHRP